MEKISAHITYKEAVRSNTATRLGIKNVPGEIALEHMKAVATNIFEPVRLHFKPKNGIRINSFFRSIKLNKAIGGSKSSQHRKGQAIDMDDTLGGFTNMEMVYWVKDNLSFDQMIIEYPINGKPQWVHISYVSRKLNRNIILITKVTKGKTSYTIWDNKNHRT